MTPSNLSTNNAISIGNAGAKLMAPQSAWVRSADGDAVSDYGLNGGASLELAYGCVDWFIYVTDSVTIGPMTQMSSND
ncbi:MAG: hypothetical protein ACREU2_12725 [Steroidobacteraceae bacterium]